MISISTNFQPDAQHSRKNYTYPISQAYWLIGSKEKIDNENKLISDTVLDTEGEGGMIWENSLETCILPYVKQMNNASLMHEAGHSKPLLWNNPEGWGGEGGGRGFRMGGHVGTCGWFMSMYGENHHNIVKYLSYK